MIIRFELSTEFTQWEQRLDARNAASTGMKPVESLAPHGLQVAANYRPTGMKPVVAKPVQSLAPHGLQVAANYRPTGMKPVVAKHRKKCFTAFPREGDTFSHKLDDLNFISVRSGLAIPWQPRGKLQKRDLLVLSLLWCHPSDA